MFTWIWGSILVPTWLHFGSQNPPKSSQKSIPRGINFLIDFLIDFLLIWARFWRPTWGHVGHIFAQNGARLWGAPLFFVGSMLFFDFLVVLAALAPFWLDFGGFGPPFWKFLGSILEVLGLHFGRFWLGMGWWGYAKRKEFFMFLLEFQ